VQVVVAQHVVAGGEVVLAAAERVVGERAEAGTRDEVGLPVVLGEEDVVVVDDLLVELRQQVDGAELQHVARERLEAARVADRRLGAGEEVLRKRLPRDGVGGDEDLRGVGGRLGRRRLLRSGRARARSRVRRARRGPR
jgi:hypothetical protein